MTTTPQLDRLVSFYQTLTPASVARFAEFYSADAFFKDPFNEVRGVEAIARIFRHMFRQIDAPRFVITTRVADASGALLIWELHYRLRLWGKEKPQVIHGASHLEFTPDGKVSHHRDYWDAAEELYTQFPLLGGLMRSLKKRLTCPQPPRR